MVLYWVENQFVLCWLMENTKKINIVLSKQRWELVYYWFDNYFPKKCVSKTRFLKLVLQKECFVIQKLWKMQWWQGLCNASLYFRRMFVHKNEAIRDNNTCRSCGNAQQLALNACIWRVLNLKQDLQSCLVMNWSQMAMMFSLKLSMSHLLP